MQFCFNHEVKTNMTTDIILSQVPTSNNKKASIIMRTTDPYSVTWDLIFSFIEQHSKIPRKFVTGVDSNGKYIYGKKTSYPVWLYDDYRLRLKNGTLASGAFITIHSGTFL